MLEMIDLTKISANVAAAGMQVGAIYHFPDIRYQIRLRKRI
jgi:hypothetical protein